MSLVDYFFGTETRKIINTNRGILEEHIAEEDLLREHKKELLTQTTPKIIYQYLIPNTLEPLLAITAYLTKSPEVFLLGTIGLELMRHMASNCIKNEDLELSRKNILSRYFTNKLKEKMEKESFGSYDGWLEPPDWKQ